MSVRPNIVLIITDHHAFYRHHRPGEFEYRWPAFDAFCDAGVRFDRAYAVCPLCSPARASVMTGQYPSAHGLRWNTEIRHQGNLIDFRPDQRLYGHYLAEAGYRNAYVGKWHCGHERLPTDYGLEGWALPDYGRVYMSDAYRAYTDARGLGDARAVIEHNLNHPEWEGETLVLHDPSPWTFMNGSGVLVGPPEAHEAFFVTHLAIEKLRELAGGSEPFSLVVSYWGPHQPYYPTEPYASLYSPADIPEYPAFDDDLAGRPFRHLIHREINHRSAERWPDWGTWQEILARCYGQARQLDDAIGRFLAALDETGAADNTLVIWCADHGDAVASHGGLWDKASTYIEEVARVPMAVRWPAAVSGGAAVDRLVSNMDVTATMLEAAGAPVPAEMHSRSLLPLCHDADAPWPDDLVCEHHGHGDNLPQRILLHDRSKYVAALFDGDELYDLAADPHELHNLIDDPDHAAPRADLRRRLIAHLETSHERNSHTGRRLILTLRSGL